MRFALAAAVLLAVAGCDSARVSDTFTLTAFTTGGDAPQTALTVEGAEEYPCLGYALGVVAEVRDDGLDAEITGEVTEPEGLCLTAIGPARWFQTLPAPVDGYVVRLRRGDDTDTFRLTTEGDRVRVDVVEASFVRVRGD